MIEKEFIVIKEILKIHKRTLQMTGWNFILIENINKKYLNVHYRLYTNLMASKRERNVSAASFQKTSKNNGIDEIAACYWKLLFFSWVTFRRSKDTICWFIDHNTWVGRSQYVGRPPTIVVSTQYLSTFFFRYKLTSAITVDTNFIN